MILMAKKETKPKAKKTAKAKAGKGRLSPVISRVLGTVLLLAVIALSAPLAVPRIMGYEVYNVVSGSMEPAIPMGSVMYVKPGEPLDVQEQEVIAFWREDAVVAHRVMYNRTSLGEFVTRGDANNVDDPEPVPYEDYIGNVETTVPYLGQFMYIYASTTGKVYLLLTAVCGVLLHVLADQQKRAARQGVAK